jgi:hypothetical protein
MQNQAINLGIAITFWFAGIALMFAICYKLLFYILPRKQFEKVMAFTFVVGTYCMILIHGKVANYLYKQQVNEPVLLDQAYSIKVFEKNNSSSAFGIGGWSVCHVIFYIVLGYFFNSHWYLLLLCSIVWELIEFLLSKLSLKTPTKRDSRWQYIEEWNGNPWDILANDIGILIGFLLRVIF